MGTGGAYRFAAESGDEATIVLNGDILTNINLTEMIRFHQGAGSEATIALIPVEDPNRYGVVEFGENGRISRFVEKPAKEDFSASVNTVNAGIYLLEPSILELIAKDTNRSFEYHVFPEILDRDMPFFGFEMKDRYWIDIGTPENYLQANMDLLAGRIAGLNVERPISDDVATHAEIDSASVIGEGCSIKPGARVVNSVVGPGVHLEEKVIIENSVVWSHTRVASFAEIRDSVVCRSCHVGRNAVVGAASVLGDKTSLTDYTRV